MRNSTSSKQPEMHVNKCQKKKKRKKISCNTVVLTKKVHLQINEKKSEQFTNPKQTAGMKMSRQSPSFSCVYFFFSPKQSVSFSSILRALWPHSGQTVPRARVQRAWLFFIVRLPSRG